MKPLTEEIKSLKKGKSIPVHRLFKEDYRAEMRKIILESQYKFFQIDPHGEDFILKRTK
jgi:hypothetical protein